MPRGRLIFGLDATESKSISMGRCSPANGKNVPGGGADRRAFHPTDFFSRRCPV